MKQDHKKDSIMKQIINGKILTPAGWLENGSVIENVNYRFEGKGAIGGIIASATPGKGNSANSIIEKLDTLSQTIADVFNELQTRDGAFYLESVYGKVQLSNTYLDQYVIFTTSDGSAEVTAGNICINSLLTLFPEHHYNWK